MMYRAFANVVSLLMLVALTLVQPSPARAQCEPGWEPFDPSTAGLPGTNGTVLAMAMWDPDGLGPRTPVVVLGGQFTIAGTAMVSNIATYDPATGQWASLGSGINGAVLALAVLPSGDLVAGGFFSTAGGTSANCLARWNGSAWSRLGSGVGGEVRALAVLPNGDLVAGGRFTTAGGVSANRIARWNGSVWSPLGLGMDNALRALCVLPNGDLVAGGEFTTAGGLTANRIARWNGSTWSPLGSGWNAEVNALAVLPDGDLVAGVAGSIARWDGSQWSSLAGFSLANGSSVVAAIAVLPNGTLVAGGRFTSSSSGWPNTLNSIAAGSGTNWGALGSGLGGNGYVPLVSALAVLPNGDVVAGGDFTSSNNESNVRSIARWNSSTGWSPLSPGMNGHVNALAVLDNGHLVAGGDFTAAGGVTANCIARWNGSAWSRIGAGLFGDSLPYVSALAPLSNGNFYASGFISSFSWGQSSHSIMWWSGAEWWNPGASANSDVSALAVLPNGHLVAGGRFTTFGGSSVNRIASSNGGSSWSALGSGLNNEVHALAVLPNGDLVAGGKFTTAGGVNASRIARWNGSTWSPLGPGLNGFVYALAVLPNGDLVAGGRFTTAGGLGVNSIARWNGTTWSALGAGINGDVYALAVLPNGNLVAAGFFTSAGGVSANSIARWNGSVWSPLGSGMDFDVYALAVLPNGDLVAGGAFSTAGGVLAPYIARWADRRILITDPPDNSTIDAGQTLVLSTAVIPGLTNVSVQWRRNGVDLTDGPGGASAGGGDVSGAAGPLPSPTTNSPITLTVTNAQSSDTGSYTAAFTNTCGSVVTVPATVNVRCAADRNNDGAVDLVDFFDFLQCYDLQQPCADIDGTPGTDLADFFLFFARFDVGC